MKRTLYISMNQVKKPKLETNDWFYAHKVFENKKVNNEITLFKNLTLSHNTQKTYDYI